MLVKWQHLWDFWSVSFCGFSGGVQIQGRMKRRGGAFPTLSCKTRTLQGPESLLTIVSLTRIMSLSRGHLCLRGRLGKQPVLPCVGYEFLLCEKGILLARKGQGRSVVGETQSPCKMVRKNLHLVQWLFQALKCLAFDLFFRIALATLTLGFIGSLCTLDLRKTSF